MSFFNWLGTSLKSFRIGFANALINAEGLSAERTYTLPDTSGTFVLSETLQNQLPNKLDVRFTCFNYLSQGTISAGKMVQFNQTYIARIASGNSSAEFPQAILLQDIVEEGFGSALVRGPFVFNANTNLSRGTKLYCSATGNITQTPSVINWVIGTVDNAVDAGGGVWNIYCYLDFTFPQVAANSILRYSFVVPVSSNIYTFNLIDNNVDNASKINCWFEHDGENDETELEDMEGFTIKAIAKNGSIDFVMQAPGYFGGNFKINYTIGS